MLIYSKESILKKTSHIDENHRMLDTKNYTITFETIKLMLRIDRAKERTLLVFSHESLSSLREAERLFIRNTVETTPSFSKASSYSSWKTFIDSYSSIVDLISLIHSTKKASPMDHSNFIKRKKTKKISPFNKSYFKGKNIENKSFSEFAEGPAINHITTNFFKKIALLFFKRYN